MAWLTINFNRDTRAMEPAVGAQAISVVSPDKAYTAKVWLPSLGGFGATISQPHQVWIEGKSGQSRLMLEVDKTNEIKVKWLVVRLLEVCCEDAQISTFRNRFVEIDRTGSETLVQTVEVRLRRVERIDECRQ